MARFQPLCLRYGLFLCGIAALFLIPDHARAQGVCERTIQVRNAMSRILSRPCAQISAAHLASLRDLNLSSWALRGDRRITELQANDFSGLTSLRKLQLWGNSLTTLPPGLFRDLGALEELRLEGNSLTALPESLFRSLSALQRLDLNGNSLTTLPEGVFRGLSSLRTLQLDENSLTALPRSVFHGLSALKGLSLQHNSLSRLSEDVFRGLGAMDSLGLEGNELSRLPERIFSDLSSLVSLNLGNNSLDALPEGIFRGLSSLQVLLLFSNSLTTLPESVFHGLRSLELVSLWENSLNELPKGLFFGLDSLEGLNLRANDLDSLPGGIFDDVLDTLTYEDSRGLQVDPGLKAIAVIGRWGQTVVEGDTVKATVILTRPLPVTVRVPYTMESTLTGDEYTELSPEPDDGLIFLAGQTSREIVLRLRTDGNSRQDTIQWKLQEKLWLRRSDGTGGDVSLDHLALVNTERITHTVTVLDRDNVTDSRGICNRTPVVIDRLKARTGVPDCADFTSVHLGRVDKLNFSFNGISGLQEHDFSGLSSLSRLDLSSNYLYGVPEGIFRGLTRLGVLDLNANFLDSLPEGVFQGLTRLGNLDLSDNSLTHLPDGIFRDSSRLSTVNLNGNSLTSLPPGLFSGLSYLDRLWLQGNSLVTLSAGIFQDQGHLRELNLGGNRLSDLPAGAFRGLDALEDLDLTGNRLNTLPEAVFKELGTLERLELDYNQLTSLPEGVFSGLDSLELAILDHNQLRSLPERIFRGLDDLEVIRLNENQLSDLPKGIFDGLKRLSRIYLENNPLPNRLPRGIFDDVLDTLLQLSLSDQGALIDFATPSQRAFKGDSVKVAVTLSHPLPVAVRMPYLVGGSASTEDYTGLSPDPEEGLLFLAGETRKEITFTLLKNTGGRDRKLVLTFGRPSAGKVYRSDGTGPEARYLTGRLFFGPPSEGANHTVTIGDFDPSALTSAMLTGKQLTLRPTGSDTSPDQREVVFNRGNRFVVASPIPETGLIRSGTFGYRNTDSHRATLTLAYDGRESCEVQLTFLKISSGEFSQSCHGEGTVEGRFRLTREGSLSFVPVILKARGLRNAFFTSELTLTNRGSEKVELEFAYKSKTGGGDGRVSDLLGPGQQKIVPDAFGYLAGLGLAIPGSGNRLGTLEVDYPLFSEVGVTVRTTTAVPDGRAGLAYPGIAGDVGFEEAVYLCGLRQNGQDRSNVAFQNMGTAADGPITVRTTVFSGDPDDASFRVLDDVELEPGEFHQFSSLLGVLRGVDGNRNGYVKVERIRGRAQFYAYGVINDQANSDGSFVFPVAESSLEGATGLVLPVVVESGDFASELTVTNLSGSSQYITFTFVADAVRNPHNTTSFQMMLASGEQKILPDIVDDLRRQGVAGIGPRNQEFAGPLLARMGFQEMKDIVVGARTGSPGGGGLYSVFYPAVPYGKAFNKSAWVYGLQQNGENRSNLALVNTGEAVLSDSLFDIEIYDGETGVLVHTISDFRVPFLKWRQINGILATYAPGTTQGYVRIIKNSGANPFLAYGVINDGGAPGLRSGDGAYLPAQE